MTLTSAQETRKKALNWWRGLRDVDREELARKHFPKNDVIAIWMSSSKIEQMYLKEHGKDN